MTRARTAVLFVLANTSAVLSCCCSRGDSQPATSSTTDAGTGAGGGDGGQAGSSTSAATSTGASGGGTSWSPVSWSPCPVDVTTNPAAEIPPLTWGACAGGAPGCQAVAITWDHSGAPLVPSVVPWGNGYRIGGLTLWPGQGNRAIVFDTDGTPLIAWRSNGDCILTPVAVAPDRVWIGAQHVDQQGGVTSAYIGGAYADVAAVSSALPLTMPSQDRIDGSNRLLLLWGDTGTSIGVYDAVTNAATVIPPPAGSLGFRKPRAAGDTAIAAYFPQFELPEAWIWDSALKQMKPLVQPSPQVIVDARSDGVAIAWIQAPPKGSPLDEQFPQGDLYTSPFASSAAELAPSKRRPGPPSASELGAIGGGYYAVYSPTDNAINVYRLSDAHHWSFKPVGSTGIRDITFIDQASVWYYTVEGVYRQALDALGPGDPAP